MQTYLSNLLIFAGLLLSPVVWAINIEISGGQEGALPIAVIPFGFEGTGVGLPDFSAVIAADLKRSGRFIPLDEKSLISQPHASAEVHFEDWRLLAVENLIVGAVEAVDSDSYRVRFELLDVFKGAGLSGLTFPSVNNKNVRRIGHQIADIVYERLTGQKGIFDTQIAYVVSGSASTPYLLQIADADGYNQKTILTSKEPILSPTWSPDNNSIAYVSFENRKPLVYIQNLMSGTREAIASYPGINSAPAWSPDGTQMAVSLSKDGNPKIYIIDLATKSARRLTTNTAIDTEPTWSPDGKSIAFTSDRVGPPQLYLMPSSGGAEKRLTFEGKYNAHPRFSPDGKKIAFVRGDGKTNHIAILDIATKSVREITTGRLDESPNFSPNGELLIYASEGGGQGTLKVVSVSGRTLPLGVSGGDMRDPAWTVFKKIVTE
ncbi:Tol-Pal system protein TolB [Gammaproteobacteria bacterium]